MSLTAAVVGASSARAASVTLKPGDDVKALTSSLQPGDVVTFSDGTYSIPSGLDWRRVDDAGTSTSPVTIKAADGAHPVLEFVDGYVIAYLHDSQYVSIEGLIFTGNADYQSHNYSGLQISNCKHVTVRDCEFKNLGNTGIYIPGDGDDITIDHTQIHDLVSGNGIYIGAGDASRIVSSSSIKNNWIYNLQGSGANAIAVVQGSYGIDIADNVIHAIVNRGMYLSQYTFGSSAAGDPITVERNAIWSVGTVGIEAHGAQVIRNNIIFNSNGFGIYSTPTDKDSSWDLVIVNNTIEGSSKQAVYLRLVANGSYELANNALCNPLGYAFQVDGVTDQNLAELTLTRNVACGLVYGPDDIKPGFVAGAGTDDFTDAESFNFWPSSTSHLIDAGSADGALEVPGDDFNGLPRASGTIDVGAYERSVESNPGWVIAEGFKVAPQAADDTPPTVESGCGSCSTAEHRRNGWMEALLLVALVGVGRPRRARR